MKRRLAVVAAAIVLTCSQALSEETEKVTVPHLPVSGEELAQAFDHYCGSLFPDHETILARLMEGGFQLRPNARKSGHQLYTSEKRHPGVEIEFKHSLPSRAFNTTITKCRVKGYVADRDDLYDALKPIRASLSKEGQFRKKYNDPDWRGPWGSAAMVSFNSDAGGVLTRRSADGQLIEKRRTRAYISLFYSR